MKTKILFPDNLHFHKRGFKSLMELVEEQSYEPIFITEHNNLKALYGNYRDHKTMFLKYYDELSDLKLEELFEKTYFGVQIFSLAKAEILSILMAKDNWLNTDIPCDNCWVFNKAFTEDKETLLLNLSAVMFWLDFWKSLIKKHKSINKCIIFSGSLIYAKTLSYLLQNTPTRVFVVEHFFSGNDYYFEEKYTHIANNSDIGYRNIYNKLLRKFNENDDVTKSKERVKAINKFLLSNNKNVTQPDRDEEDHSFETDKPTVLIIGQVINDFSIIETKLPNINSLQVYLKLIKGLLEETDFNIIFKAHPWEKSKINIRRSLTKDMLQSYLMATFTEADQKRVMIVEDFNLQQLLEKSDFVTAFCSQALIEAAYLGKKCCQFGKAFFGNKGFTHDFSNESELIDALKDYNISGELTMDEYEKFMTFLTIFYQFHSVSIHESGKSMLKTKMQKHALIPVVQDKSQAIISPSQKIQEKALPLKSKESKTLIHLNEIGSAPLKKKIIENLIVRVSSEKKVEKFKSNPKKFFDDSNYLLVKLFGKIYYFFVKY
ncbi:MAG: hypothetical protein RBR97_19100 [Bacteroidales bacterium]|nr:hypothetical protein [Bacteroidales bacterium]